MGATVSGREAGVRGVLPRAPAGFSRPTVHGKFLWLGSEKFFPKGVTYGAFAPNSQGHQFPEPPEVDRDFGLMRQAGINTILTYTVPPMSLLDQAQAHGLRVIVNTPWMGHVCFLEEAGTRRRIRREVREAVASCQRHPAVLMYCVAKELPPPIVRWYGSRKIEKFLEELYHVAKDVDPDSLVTYTNFPTTEYLRLPFVDVYTFNLYLHQRQDFCGYLSRLQHIAGELPMVLTECGMCSFRHGDKEQAEFLDWQLTEIFDHGIAGAVVFGWTDPFYQDNTLVTDWGFGLVNAERQPKPAYEVVKRRFTTGVPFQPARQWPKVSVVVAFYNAARTLDDCLNSLQKLRYPNFEVICVNDGSTDGSAEILKRYPFRSITTPNRGVSAARNEGLRAATGDIIAYIDSDARADGDWLNYLVATYQESDVGGVGGPNPVPPEDGWIAQCVFRAPGGPTQVMLNDRHAEHIPGCNMSFSKSALEQIGGFDPTFTKAGDDVDICWRLLERGYKLGFSPSAIVWHHRRPSVTAYWRQQVGYGEAESLLERKHPGKFNAWGHVFWDGCIYAPYPFFRLLHKPVIYEGLWGSAGFQSMYQEASGNPLAYLPRCMEWHMAMVGLLVAGFFIHWLLVPAVLGIGYTAGFCVVTAADARLSGLLAHHGPDHWRRRLRWRAMLAWLNFLEPAARDWGRLKGGLTPWRAVAPPPAQPADRGRWWQQLQPFRRIVRWGYRGTMELEKFALLERLTRTLNSRHCAVAWNPVHANWDLKVRRGALGEAFVRAVVEHHGGAKRLARLSADIRQTRLMYWAQGLFSVTAVATGVLGHWAVCATAAALFAGCWIAATLTANRLASALRVATDDVVKELQDGNQPRS